MSASEHLHGLHGEVTFLRRRHVAAEMVVRSLAAERDARVPSGSHEAICDGWRETVARRDAEIARLRLESDQWRAEAKQAQGERDALKDEADRAARLGRQRRAAL